jgi:GNAT superfamily N-acetyltransferase
MIRQCRKSDIDVIYFIVNEAAKSYERFIPTDCYHQPYMSMAELQTEFKRMTFYGWEENGTLAGCMGFEPVKDVTLIRHAYVLPDWQNKGIGAMLLKKLIQLTKTKRLLVGMWEANEGAARFYKRHGFTIQLYKDELLKNYWNISARQIETSIVMELRK